MRTVVFDLDGTLADTSQDLIAAANACFEALGHGAMLDPVVDAAMAFRGGRAMLTLGFSRLGEVDQELVEVEFHNLIKYYAGAIDVYTRLYPGVVETLTDMRARGYTLSICTNKPEPQAEDLMQRLGVRDLFGALIGADTLPVRKPDPAPYQEAVIRAGGDPAKSLLVGDTVTDRDTARAAGVPVILVTFGPDGEAVADLEPDALLPDYAALPGLVADLIG